MFKRTKPSSSAQAFEDRIEETKSNEHLGTLEKDMDKIKRTR